MTTIGKTLVLLSLNAYLCLQAIGSDQLKLEVYYSKIHPITVTNNNSDVIDKSVSVTFRMYLRNISGKALNVATKGDNWKKEIPPIKSVVLAITQPLAPTRENIIMLPSEYGRVLLQPNQLAYLHKITFETNPKEFKLEDYEFCYRVFSDAGANLDVWSGEVYASKLVSDVEALREYEQKSISVPKQ